MPATAFGSYPLRHFVNGQALPDESKDDESLFAKLRGQAAGIDFTHADYGITALLSALDCNHGEQRPSFE